MKFLQDTLLDSAWDISSFHSVQGSRDPICSGQLIRRVTLTLVPVYALVNLEEVTMLCALLSVEDLFCYFLYSKHVWSNNLGTTRDYVASLPAYCHDHVMKYLAEIEPEDCPHYFGTLVHVMLAILQV